MTEFHDAWRFNKVIVKIWILFGGGMDPWLPVREAYAIVRVLIHKVRLWLWLYILHAICLTAN